MTTSEIQNLVNDRRESSRRSQDAKTPPVDAINLNHHAAHKRADARKNKIEEKRHAGLIKKNKLGGAAIGAAVGLGASELAKKVLLKKLKSKIEDLKAKRNKSPEEKAQLNKLIRSYRNKLIATRAIGVIGGGVAGYQLGKRRGNKIQKVVHRTSLSQSRELV